MLLLNPLLWLMTLVWVVTRATAIEALYPPPIWFMGASAMFLGNLLFVYFTMGGCMLRGLYPNVKWMLLAPLYWMLMSLAAWKALLQFFVRPHHWEKTVHGLVERTEVAEEAA
jgi:hypothetical protein